MISGEPGGKAAGGLDANVAAALCYSLGWISGVVFLLTEPQNKLVRFHAMQSTIAFGGLSLAWILGLAIPFVGWIFSFLIVVPFSVLLWLVMIFKAYQGDWFKLPVVGDMAEARMQG